MFESRRMGQEEEEDQGGQGVAIEEKGPRNPGAEAGLVRGDLREGVGPPRPTRQYERRDRIPAAGLEGRDPAAGRKELPAGYSR